MDTMNLATDSKSASADAPPPSSQPLESDTKVNNPSLNQPRSDRQTSDDHVLNSDTSLLDEQDRSGPIRINSPDEEDEENSLEEDEEFNPAQCLFCNRIHSSFDENLAHMCKTHSFFILDQDRLVVDVETLITYFRLVIFGYHQCLFCGTQRGSFEAAQQHMVGKSHCKYDVSKENSEYREFYDFESIHDNDNNNNDNNNDDNEEEEEKSKDDIKTLAKRTTFPFVQVDDESLRLPSGKIVSHRCSHPPRPQQHQNHHIIDNNNPQLDPIPFSSSSPISNSAPNQCGPGALTKIEKRNVTLCRQLVHLRANDQRSLIHLPVSKQLALLATQKKQMDQARKAERRIQSRVEGMGNTTLMKHFVNDVPGRSNG